MSQHDYNIANQTGAAFRADLNNALLAAVSQNSGTAEPAPTFAYMLWADTQNNLLKIRNAANNGWITVGALGTAYLGLQVALGYTAADDSAVVKLTGAQSIGGAKRGSVTALTDAATITPDLAVGNNFSLTLGGNRTLANPTNIVAGQSGIIAITQDATGSRTLAFGSYWKFPSGTAETLTTTANAVDLLAYYVDSTTAITIKKLGDRK